LFETGAGGSAPKHVQQFVEENHLRWDSLGEYLALCVSLEDVAAKSKNPKAQILASALDEAIGKVLDNGQSPSRKVNELDNRGSHFYLAKYWAEALATQSHDAGLKAYFAPLAKALAENEEKIIEELTSCQGDAIDMGGYFMPDPETVEKLMRPSETLNGIMNHNQAG
jgi:isocitrate dehydrogenase